MTDGYELAARIKAAEHDLNLMYAELQRLGPSPEEIERRKEITPPPATGEWAAQNPWFGSPAHAHREAAYRMIDDFLTRACGIPVGPESLAMLDGLARDCPMVRMAERMDAERNGEWE